MGSAKKIHEGSGDEVSNTSVTAWWGDKRTNGCSKAAPVVSINFMGTPLVDKMVCVANTIGKAGDEAS